MAEPVRRRGALLVAREQARHRERHVERVLDVVIDRVAAQVILVLAEEEPVKIVEGHPEDIERVARPGLLEERLHRVAHVLRRADADTAGDVVLVRPDAERPARRVLDDGGVGHGVRVAVTGFLHRTAAGTMPETGLFTGILTAAWTQSTPTFRGYWKVAQTGA